jgi:hypothetical protein
LIYEKYLNPWDENGNYVPNRIEETASYVTWKWNNKEQTEFYFCWPPDWDNNSDGVIDDKDGDGYNGVARITNLTKTYMRIEETNEYYGEVWVTEFYRD